jgi:hypothetical protein
VNSQRLAGICATIIAVIVLAASFYYVPPTARVASGQAPAKPAEKTDVAPVRGPVVRDVPNGTVTTPSSAPVAPGSRGPVVRDVPQ